MKLLFLSISLSWALSTQSAPFQNLEFDEANTNSVQISIGPGSVLQGVGLVSDLLPGWQLYHGSTVVTQIYFNTSPPFPDAVSLDTDGQGRYRLEFFDTDVPFSLVQRGDIPADAWGLFFNSQGGQGYFDVSVNGSSIMTSPGYSAYIAPWAGQNVELRFSTALNSAPENRYFLSTIYFTVPEPPPMLLVGIALACGALWSGWRESRRTNGRTEPGDSALVSGRTSVAPGR